MEVNVLLKDFVLRLENRHKISVHTLRAYQKDIHDFSVFYQRKAGTVPIDQGIKSTLRLYLQDLLDRNYKPGTIRRKMSVLHNFCRFLISGKMLSFDPFIFLGRIKLPGRKAKLNLSEEDAKKLTAHLNTDKADHSPKYSYYYRDKAIMAVLCTTRLKTHELTSLNIQDVDLFNGIISLNNSKGRTNVSIGNSAVNRLRQYVLNEAGEGTLPLFRNRYGNKLSAKSICTIVRQEGKACGIGAHLTPRLLGLSPKNKCKTKLDC